MLWYLTRLTLSQGTFSSSLSGGGVIILSYCLSSPITPITNPGQGFIYTYTFFFYLNGFLLFFFYFFALQNKICLIGSCSIFLLIILFVIVFLIVRQFSPDDSWSSTKLGILVPIPLLETSFRLFLLPSTL